MHDKWTSPELDSLLGDRSLTRRQVLVTSLATGFALAVQPVGAQTITTDTAGLTAGEVKIPVADGEIPAYRAMPATGGSSRSCSSCRKSSACMNTSRTCAAASPKPGYCAIAPELYARQGDVSKITDWKQIFAEVVGKVPDAQVMADLDAAAAWAEKSARRPAQARDHRFLLGRAHRLALRGAQPEPQGGRRLVRPHQGPGHRLQPKYPFDVVADIGAPVLGLYGGKDQGIPLDDVEAMRAALKAAGKPSEIVVFPEAGHAFFADYRPSFRAEDAAAGWAACIAWFRQHGVG